MPDILYLSKPVEEIMETWLGDTVNFTMPLKDKDGNAVDLTEWTARLVCSDMDKRQLFTIDAEVIEDGAKFKFLKEDWDSSLTDGSYTYKLITTGPDGTYTVLYGEYKIH